MSEAFDDTAERYGALVQESIAFAGREHAYFLRRKAEILAEVILRHGGDPSSASVLDVGCGVGGVASHLVERVGRLIGIEPSLESLRQARDRLDSTPLCGSEGGRLPFRDGVFDLTFTVNVLHHVDPEGRDPLIAEMVRVTRPGGLVTVFEHNPLNPLTRLSVARCEFDEGVELLGRRELRRRLRTAGATVVESRYIIFTPFDVSWQHRIEQRIGRVPLGAQHFVAARKA